MESKDHEEMLALQEPLDPLVFKYVIMDYNAQAITIAQIL